MKKGIKILITFGWTITIFLFTLFIASQMDITNIINDNKESCSFQTEIFCANPKQDNNEFSFAITNNLGKEILLTDIITSSNNKTCVTELNNTIVKDQGFTTIKFSCLEIKKGLNEIDLDLGIKFHINQSKLYIDGKMTKNIK